ncbi:glycosyltransferase, partial [Aminipila sp.]|uniref:glycosyltransferase n=1 Tax=Aminipila sp. TaxID=2060095 RepID=UPI0028A2AA76
MKVLCKILNSWQHFGTVALFSKAWEKFVIDKYRFRTNFERIVPIFPERAHKTAFQKSLGQGDEKLSICYLIHYFFPDKQGGTERFVLNLAKEQQRLGNQVRVITLGKRPLKQYNNKIQNIYWKDFVFDGIPITQVRYKRAPRGLYYDTICDDEPNMMAFAENFFNRHRIDVVHVAYPQPFSSFLTVCKQKKIPYMVTLTDFNILCHYATMVAKSGEFCNGSQCGAKCEKRCHTYGVKDPQRRYILAEKLLSNADYLTVPSEFVAKIIEHEFPNISVEAIPHGIGESFTIKHQRTSTKRFIYAGTLSDLKGVKLLIKVFTKLPDMDISLHIYGEGEPTYVNLLKRLAKADKRISFYGSISANEISKVYQEADCVIVPSLWYETYNFVLREALACGCLAVTSKIGAMPEAVDEGNNGYLFEAGNAKDLSKALNLAVNFNWKKYKESIGVTREEECSKYQLIYEYCLENAGTY